MSTSLALRRADKWRSALNPLRGFAIQRAVSLLEAGERGAYANLQWAYRFLEKRQATLRGLKRLRLAAIAKLDWDIKLVDTGDDAATKIAAEAQAAELRKAYDAIENLRQAIRFLALAEFRGFAHLEKRYQGDNPELPVVRLEPVEQWYWCRDSYLGAWQYNARSQVATRGEPVELGHFLVREVEDPINEIALLAFAAEGLGKKDWAGFIEVFGIPPLFGELPAEANTEGKAKEFQEMMEAVIGDSRGTHPNGAKVYTVGDGARGINPFRDFLEYLKEEIVLAGTSGKLTMLSSPTGIGQGATGAHQDTFDSLAQDEAGEISELLQEQFDKPLLRARFPGQPVLAYFELCAQDKTDIGQVLDHALKASQAGLRIDPVQLSEKTGYKLTAAPAVPAPPVSGLSAPGVANRQSQIANRSGAPAAPATPLAQLLTAAAKDLAPARGRIEAILRLLEAGKDEAALSALEQLQADFPALLESPHLSAALEGALGTAALEGAKQALPTQ